MGEQFLPLVCRLIYCQTEIYGELEMSLLGFLLLEGKVALLRN